MLWMTISPDLHQIGIQICNLSEVRQIVSRTKLWF